jgi:hypothetical protein
MPPRATLLRSGTAATSSAVSRAGTTREGGTARSATRVSQPSKRSTRTPSVKQRDQLKKPVRQTGAKSIPQRAEIRYTRQLLGELDTEPYRTTHRGTNIGRPVIRLQKTQDGPLLLLRDWSNVRVVRPSNGRRRMRGLR